MPPTLSHAAHASSARTRVPRKQKLLLPILTFLLILVNGLVLRLSLTPLPGYGFDVGVNKGWAYSAVKLGAPRSYHEQLNGNMLPNYPPLALLIFEGAGHVYQAFSPSFDLQTTLSTIIIKLPAIIADLLTAAALGIVLWRRRSPWMGCLAAGIATFHPATFYESAVWGQTDSLYTLFLVLAVLLFAEGLPSLAAACFALSLLTKLHAIMLLPLFALLYLTRGWKTMARGILGAGTAAACVLSPFIAYDGLSGVWQMYTKAVGYYDILSSAAYNFWWALFADTAGNIKDTSFLFGFLTYRQAGLLLFAIASAAILFPVFRSLRRFPSPNRRMEILFYAASLLAFAFFLFTTEMHERYLFPFVALGIPAALANRRTAFLYGMISFLFFMNILGWLPATPVDRALYATFPSLDVFIAATQVTLFFLYLRHFFDIAALVRAPAKR